MASQGLGQPSAARAVAPLARLPLVAVLLLSLGAGERSPLLLGAYYYPWYRSPKWVREPPAHEPRLGLYDSGEEEVASQHARWAREAGIDFFVVSWISHGDYGDDNLRDVVVPALERQGVRYALLYETALALGLPAGEPLPMDRLRPDGRRAGDVMVDQLRTIAAEYLTRPGYMRWRGRPVLVIYLVRDMVGAAPYLERARAELRALGIEPYWVADVVYWTPPSSYDWGLLGSGFQALTAYNMYFHRNFLAAVSDQYAAVDDAARAHGLTFIPDAMPGYDDTILRGKDRPVIERDRGAFYRSSWAVAARHVSVEQPFLLVSTFNEWHEGSEIEPSMQDGDAYLTETRDLVDGLGRR